MLLALEKSDILLQLIHMASVFGPHVNDNTRGILPFTGNLWHDGSPTESIVCLTAHIDDH